MRISRAGFGMIKVLYGFRAEAEPLSAPDFQPPDAPVYVIGHGHRRFARRGLRIGAPDAHDLLRFDLLEIETILRAMLPEGTEPCQFDSLASLALDIGLGRLALSRTLARFKAGDAIGAADAFDDWRGPALGLVGDLADQALRRATEKANFLCGRFAPATRMRETFAERAERVATALAAIAPATPANADKARDPQPPTPGPGPDRAPPPEPAAADPAREAPAGEAPLYEVHVGAAAREGFWPNEAQVERDAAAGARPITTARGWLAFSAVIAGLAGIAAYWASGRATASEAQRLMDWGLGFGAMGAALLALAVLRSGLGTFRRWFGRGRSSR